MKKTTFLLVFSSYTAGILVLATIYYIGTSYKIPFEKFTADPAHYYQSHPFSGVLSNLGVLLWCASTVLCLFTGIGMIAQNQGHLSKFLLASGAFSALLLVDDLFMFHDFLFHSIGNFYFEWFFYLLYGFLVLLYLYTFRQHLGQHRAVFFLAAIFFLGISVSVDIFIPPGGVFYFYEDAAKFLGIISWALFYSLTCFEMAFKKV